MVLTREARSPVLRVVGFTLWADALLTLILGIGSGALFVSAGHTTPDAAIRRARSDAAAGLVHVTSLSRATIDSFEQSGSFDRGVLAHLSASERNRTERILEQYDSAVESAGVRSARRSIGIPVMCLALFVAGLFLTLKRDVWRCITCGHAKRVARRRAPWMPPLLGQPRTD